MRLGVGFHYCLSSHRTWTRDCNHRKRIYLSQLLQCGGTAVFVEVGSDDKRGGSGLASAASLVYSASVFSPSIGPLAPSPAPRIEPGTTWGCPICAMCWTLDEEGVAIRGSGRGRGGFLACGTSGRFASDDRFRSSTMSKADVLHHPAEQTKERARSLPWAVLSEMTTEFGVYLLLVCEGGVMVVASVLI